MQEVRFFAVRFSGSVVSPAAPPGWSTFVHPIVGWAATDIGQLPPDFVDDGNVVPSPFQIKPGQTLEGFSDQSPDPPGGNQFFAEGFTNIPEPSRVNGVGYRRAAGDFSSRGGRQVPAAYSCKACRSTQRSVVPSRAARARAAR